MWWQSLDEERWKTSKRQGGTKRQLSQTVLCKQGYSKATPISIWKYTAHSVAEIMNGNCFKQLYHHSPGNAYGQSYQEGDLSAINISPRVTLAANTNFGNAAHARRCRDKGLASQQSYTHLPAHPLLSIQPITLWKDILTRSLWLACRSHTSYQN